jgi:hypothetical protein
MDLPQGSLKSVWRRNFKYFNTLTVRKEDTAAALADRPHGGPSRDPATGNVSVGSGHVSTDIQQRILPRRAVFDDGFCANQ